MKTATEGKVTNATVYALRHSHASTGHYVSTLTVPEICGRTDQQWRLRVDPRTKRAY